MSSDNYRDGCSGRRYGRFIVGLVTMAAWFFTKLDRRAGKRGW